MNPYQGRAEETDLYMLLLDSFMVLAVMGISLGVLFMLFSPGEISPQMKIFKSGETSSLQIGRTTLTSYQHDVNRGIFLSEDDTSQTAWQATFIRKDVDTWMTGERGAANRWTHRYYLRMKNDPTDYRVLRLTLKYVISNGVQALGATDSIFMSYYNYEISYGIPDATKPRGWLELDGILKKTYSSLPELLQYLTHNFDMEHISPNNLVTMNIYHKAN